MLGFDALGRLALGQVATVTQGALAASEAADTVAFAASFSDRGALATTEAADTAALAATFADKGALATTESADTAALAGTFADKGAFATTESADTAALVAAFADTGTLTATETTDTAAFAGTLADSGTLATTETADTAVFAATFGSTTGTLAATEARDTAAFAGSAVGGNAEPQYTGRFSGWESHRTKRERLRAEHDDREHATRKKKFKELVEHVVRPPSPPAPEEPELDTTPVSEPAPHSNVELEIAKLREIAANARVVAAEIIAKANLAERKHQREYDDALAILLLTSA